MDEMEPKVKAALDTILWFEDSLTEVEAKTGELFHVLEKHNIDPEPVYEIFKVFSQIRFHMAESHEYQSLLGSRPNKKTSPNCASIPEEEELLLALAEENSQHNAQSPPITLPAPLHRRLESRLAAFLKSSFYPLRKTLAESDRPPLI